MNVLKYSIVIPIYNESGVLEELHERLSKVMKALDEPYELIFVEDGSQDDSLEILKNISGADHRVVIVEHCRNFGQTAALANGFKQAQGDLIISMDGDLQHDPGEIPDFINKIEEGYDIVSGWRVRRLDNVWTRKIPSRIANWIMAKLSGVELHDFGTTFKAYRRDIIDNIELMGEMHRFVPALISRKGASISEIPIRNIPRPKGTSNYNLTRTFHVIFDMLTIKFLISYMDRPLHLYGGVGLLFFGCGFFIAALLTVLYYFAGLIIQHHLGNLILSVLLMILGVQITAFGLIMEIVSRIYMNTNKVQIYPVRRVYGQQLINDKNGTRKYVC